MFGRLIASSPDASAPASAESRFSLMELRKLHKQLDENKCVDDNNQALVVEILRVIAEMVVYGDNKSELLFDFFCEKNMLSLFLEIMSSPGGCPSTVHIQILQTLSILISCVRNETSLYYLLSNNYINEIILHAHDFADDESLCAQFASFMKSLSLKLNIQTVQFFFIEESGAFPILTRAVELLTIPDPMIRIASQSTILNVYRVEDARARAYALQDDVMGVMFAQTISFMEGQFRSMVVTCASYAEAGKTPQEITRLENRLDDSLSALEDWFYYLQDLLDLDVPVFRRSLIRQLLQDFVLPVLFGPLLKAHAQYLEDGLTLRRFSEIGSGGGEEERRERAKVDATVSYLLQMLRIVNHPAFHSAVLITLYHPLNGQSREQLLRELSASDAAADAGTAATAATTPTNAATATTAPEPKTERNPIKHAWDDIHLMGDPRLALLKVHVDHLLFVKVLTSAESPEDVGVDQDITSATSSVGVDVDLVSHEVHENYVSDVGSTCPSITPLRPVRDPKWEAVQLLRALYVLPPREPSTVARELYGGGDAAGGGDGDGDRDWVGGVVGGGSGVGSSAAEGVSTVVVEAEEESGSMAVKDAPGSCSEPVEEGGRPIAAGVEVEEGAGTWKEAEEEIEIKETGAGAGAGTEIGKGKGTGTEEAEEGASGKDTPLTMAFSELLQFRGDAYDDSDFEADGPGPVQTNSSASGIGGIGGASTGARGGLGRGGKRRRSRIGRNDMLMPAESTLATNSALSSAEQVELPTLLRLDALLTRKLDSLPHLQSSGALGSSASSLCSMLLEPHGHTLAALQVAVHSLGALCWLLTAAAPATASARAEQASLREPLVACVRVAVRQAAGVLLDRLDGPLSEMLLLLVKEEVGRFAGQSWKRSVEKMQSDLLLFLPPTSSVQERMGIDFQQPISQVERIRKEIQTFLLLRALHKQVRGCSRALYAADALTSSVADKQLLCLDESNIVFKTLAPGCPYDMRGKRFLDVKVVPQAPPASDSYETSTYTPKSGMRSPPGSSPPSSMWSASASMQYTRKLFGSSSGTPSSSAGNSPAPAGVGVGDVEGLASSKLKILFVQDGSSLLLVSCDKHDTRNGFKLLVVAPLLYTDAQLNPEDPTRFKVVVRSAKEVPHMRAVFSAQEMWDDKGDSQDSPRNTRQSATPVPPGTRAATFLKPGERTRSWELSLKVDNEQACRLAVLHIEGRRRELGEAKKEETWTLLRRWASDLDELSADD